MTASLPQDPDELFDVVDERGQPTGVVKRRANVHRDGDWHRSVHVWVVGRHAGEAFILFQRRSAGKDIWPDMLDATAAGHLGVGESVTDAMREIEEELGIVPDLQGLRHIGTRFNVSEIAPDVLDREVQEVFLLRDDRPLHTYAPAVVEVAGLVQFPLDPLLALFRGDRERAPGMVLNAATGKVFRADIPPSEFIPVTDDYFARVADTARALLRRDHQAPLEPAPNAW